MIRSSLLALLVFAFGSNAKSADSPALKTVDHVDIQRYTGRWYEIARLPNRFEKKCDRDVTAEYSLDGKTLRVSNACRKADGALTRAAGKAKIVDSATNAKLKVTFFWPFYGDYWILGLDPQYRWAVVGEPSRKFLWILSRTPKLTESEMQKAELVVRDSGYERSGLIFTRHD